MTTPHRKLLCARCGAAPSWVSSEDGPAPLCTACASIDAARVEHTKSTSPAARPTPQPAHAVVPLRFALAAVCAAMLLPRAALVERLGDRTSRAFVAAVSAFGASDGPVLRGPAPSRPVIVARSSAPSVHTVVAQPIPVASVSPEAPQSSALTSIPGSLVVTPEFARMLPAAFDVRPGDLLTRLDGRAVLDPTTRQVCRNGSIGVWLEGFRRGFPFANHIRCADFWRGTMTSRNVARPSGDLLPARRWQADLPRERSRARSTESRPRGPAPWPRSFERDGRGLASASR